MTQLKTITEPELILPIPPNAEPLEAAVLGACLLDKKAFFLIYPLLSEQSFFSLKNRAVFSAMKSLGGKNRPIDILTVTEEMHNKEAASYLVDLTMQVTSAANIEYHAHILKQYEIQREIIQAGAFMVKAGYDKGREPLDLLNDVQKRTLGLTGLVGMKREMNGHELARRAVEKTDRLRKSDYQVLGVPSGFHDMDKLTDGWQPSDLIIIAARPGMGKTAFGLSMTRNILNTNLPVGFFSLEMAADQLINRLMSIEAGVPAGAIKNPKRMNDLQYQSYIRAAEWLTDAKVFIDDSPYMTIIELRSKARRMVLEHKVGIIIIDYLQLITGDTRNGNRDQEIGSITRGLKALAKELDIPIIALCQLSRAVESRGGMKRPQLSDLRESGNIEQDADIVSFLYRPEYYGIKEDKDGNSVEGLAEVDFAKHRNGALDTVTLRFEAKYVKFCNFDERMDALFDTHFSETGTTDDLPF